MNSTYEYCQVFKKAEQIGRLYVLPSGHARGSTFRIYVLPEGRKVTDGNFFKMNLDNDIVEVYGIISGQPGWHENYGWLHEGKWQTDFEEIYQKRLKELLSLFKHLAIFICAIHYLFTPTLNPR